MDNVEITKPPPEAPAESRDRKRTTPHMNAGSPHIHKQESRGRRLRRALTAANIGFWEYRRGADHIWLDARAGALLGLSACDQTIPLAALMGAIHPDDAAMFRAGVEGDGALRITYRTLESGGAQRWLRSFGDWSRPHEGARLTGVTLDATEEMARRQEADLVLKEMRHRTGNLFSILGGLTSLNAATARSAADLARTLRGRLAALSRSHALSAGGGLPGEADGLAPLIKALVEPFAHGPEQFELDGPDIPLLESARTPLSLVIYEWATNAVKYGALSSRTGRVSIRWDLTSDGFHLTWAEAGGPAVSEPAELGFGNQLQALALAKIGGGVATSWRSGGVVITLDARADLVAR